MNKFKLYIQPDNQERNRKSIDIAAAENLRDELEKVHLEGIHQYIEKYLLENKNLSEISRETLEVIAKNAVYAPHKIDGLYKVYRIPKESGGYRVIEAPSDELKAIQREILKDVIYKEMEPSYMAYGFVPFRNVKQNARKHGGSLRQDNTNKWLWKMDLRNFFPSISSLMVIIEARKENNFMYNLRLETDISRLYRLMMVIYLCFYKERLPQGAPTSPALSNYAMRSMDRTIAGIIKSATSGNTLYTRYADDICISGDYKEDVAMAGYLVTKSITQNTPCSVNPKKTALCCHGRPMRVTGVNINHGTTISRWKRDHVRGRLHTAVKQGYIPYKEKAQLTGYMAHYKNIDEQGWNSRCGNLFQQMKSLPVRG